MTAKRAAKKSKKRSKKSVAAQGADAVISNSESSDLLTLTAISQATVTSPQVIPALDLETSAPVPIRRP